MDHERRDESGPNGETDGAVALIELALAEVAVSRNVERTVLKLRPHLRYYAVVAEEIVVVVNELKSLAEFSQP